MERTLKDILVEQLDALLTEHRQFRSRSQYDDLSDLNDLELFRLTSRVRAALERIAGRSSVYARQFEDIQTASLFSSPGPRLAASIGVIEALRQDLKAGHLRALSELLHGEVFSDLLEMADHFATQGYKDAAAVVAGQLSNPISGDSPTLHGSTCTWTQIRRGRRRRIG